MSRVECITQWQRLWSALAIGFFAAVGCANALPRSADWQVALAPDDVTGAILLRRVEGGSPAEDAGLRPGDRVLTIDGRPIRDPLDVLRARHGSRSGSEVVFTVERAGVRVDARFRPRAALLEQHPGIEIRYESALTSRGFEVRLLVTHPKGSGPWPAVVFIPWLSCDSIDFPLGPQDGWSRMLFDLIRESGWVVVRIEKAGAGDSTGPSCVDADLEADLAGFRAGLRKVGQLPYVNPKKMFLFGGSIGGALAPVLARESMFKGVVVTGGFYKTWLEHMLELERRRLALAGRTPGEVNAALRGYADFYSLYLNGGATPGDVARKRPDLASLWYGLPGHQYGRPAQYYHQVQALNVAEAWAAVDAPVLVVYGEYDWIMSRDDQELIVDSVNRRRPGSARLVVVPRMGHNIETFASMAKAFEDDSGEYTRAVIDAVLQWLREVVAQ
jgi:pimeloyl-ACP methyl ester carboxylesterase